MTEKEPQQASLIAAILGIYILPFLIILIDELVLRTYWFSKYLPEWVGDAMHVLYPFHQWFHR